MLCSELIAQLAGLDDIDGVTLTLIPSETPDAAHPSASHNDDGPQVRESTSNAGREASAETVNIMLAAT